MDMRREVVQASVVIPSLAGLRSAIRKAGTVSERGRGQVHSESWEGELVDRNVHTKCATHVCIYIRSEDFDARRTSHCTAAQALTPASQQSEKFQWPSFMILLTSSKIPVISMFYICKNTADVYDLYKHTCCLCDIFFGDMLGTGVIGTLLRQVDLEVGWEILSGDEECEPLLCRNTSAARGEETPTPALSALLRKTARFTKCRDRPW